MSKLMGRELDSYKPEDAQTWIGKSPFTRTGQCYRKVFIPLNDNRVHWTLLVIDFEIHTITYFDSTSDGKKLPRFPELRKHPVQVMFRFLQYVANKLGSPMSSDQLDQWRLYYDDLSIDERPRDPKISYAYQTNSDDCGIFVLVTAEVLFFAPSLKQSRLMLSNYLSCVRIHNNQYRKIIALLVLSFHESQFPFLYPKSFNRHYKVEDKIMSLSIEDVNKYHLDNRPQIEVDPYLYADQPVYKSHYANFDIINKIVSLMKYRNDFIEKKSFWYVKEDTPYIKEKKSKASSNAYKWLLEDVDCESRRRDLQESNLETNDDFNETLPNNNPNDDEFIPDYDYDHTKVNNQVQYERKFDPLNLDNEVYTSLIDRFKTHVGFRESSIHGQLMKFSLCLKENPFFDFGFRLYSSENLESKSRLCTCPLSNAGENFKFSSNLKFLSSTDNETHCCAGGHQYMTPYELMCHLDSHRHCPFHLIVFCYLKQLYQFWWKDIIFQEDDTHCVSHYALFKERTDSQREAIDLFNKYASQSPIMFNVDLQLPKCDIARFPDMYSRPVPTMLEIPVVEETTDENTGATLDDEPKLSHKPKASKKLDRGTINMNRRMDHAYESNKIQNQKKSIQVEQKKNEDVGQREYHERNRHLHHGKVRNNHSHYGPQPNLHNDNHNNHRNDNRTKNNTSSAHYYDGFYSYEGGTTNTNGHFNNVPYEHNTSYYHHHGRSNHSGYRRNNESGYHDRHSDNSRNHDRSHHDRSHPDHHNNRNHHDHHSRSPHSNYDSHHSNNNINKKIPKHNQQEVNHKNCDNESVVITKTIPPKQTDDKSVVIEKIVPAPVPAPVAAPVAASVAAPIAASVVAPVANTVVAPVANTVVAPVANTVVAKVADLPVASSNTPMIKNAYTDEMIKKMVDIISDQKNKIDELNKHLSILKKDKDELKQTSEGTVKLHSVDSSNIDKKSPTKTKTKKSPTKRKSDTKNTDIEQKRSKLDSPYSIKRDVTKFPIAKKKRNSAEPEPNVKKLKTSEIERLLNINDKNRCFYELKEDEDYEINASIHTYDSSISKGKRRKISKQVLTSVGVNPEDYLHKTVKVHCYEDEDQEFGLTIKSAFLSEDGQDFQTPLYHHVHFVLIFEKFNNYKHVLIRGVHTINHIRFINKNKQKAFLRIPVSSFQQHHKDNRKKQSKKDNDSNSESNVYSVSSYNVNSITFINASQISDDSEHAPLLPPDVFNVMNRNQNYDDIEFGRGWYNELSTYLHEAKYKHRKQLPKSYYSSLYGKTNLNIIDWRKNGDMDINVSLDDNTLTMIRVRKAPKSLTKRILLLHKRLSQIGTGNCRSDDEGIMFGLGMKNANKEYVLNRDNKDVRVMIKNIGKQRKKWLTDIFDSTYLSEFNEEHELEYMSDGLSDFMVHSISLANSSHYDVNDQSLTTATWVEESEGNTNNWYLLFPNVTIANDAHQNGQNHTLGQSTTKATAIQLFHGCTVTWDARRLRHASSRVSYVDRDKGTSGGNCEVRKK